MTASRTNRVARLQRSTRHRARTVRVPPQRRRAARVPAAAPRRGWGTAPPVPEVGDAGRQPLTCPEELRLDAVVTPRARALVRTMIGSAPCQRIHAMTAARRRRSGPTVVRPTLRASRSAVPYGQPARQPGGYWAHDSSVPGGQPTRDPTRVGGSSAATAVHPRAAPVPVPPSLQGRPTVPHTCLRGKPTIPLPRVR